MTENKLKKVVHIISFTIWLFFLTLGISDGIEADLNKTWEFKDPKMILYYKLAVSIMPFLSSLIFSIMVIKDKSPQTRLGKIADNIIGNGFSDLLEKTIHFPVLGALCFLLSGGVGLIKAMFYGATEKSVFDMVFSISFGAGIAIPLIIHRLYKFRKSQLKQ